MAETVSPYDLEEGDDVTLVWSPYGWAREHQGYSSKMSVTVDDKSSFCEPGGLCDIALESTDGDRFVHHADNGYISGDASGVPDDDRVVGMPDWTDVGRFRRYER